MADKYIGWRKQLYMGRMALPAYSRPLLGAEYGAREVCLGDGDGQAEFAHCERPRPRGFTARVRCLTKCLRASAGESRPRPSRAEGEGHGVNAGDSRVGTERGRVRSSAASPRAPIAFPLHLTFSLLFVRRIGTQAHLRRPQQHRHATMMPRAWRAEKQPLRWLLCAVCAACARSPSPLHAKALLHPSHGTPRTAAHLSEQ